MTTQPQSDVLRDVCLAMSLLAHDAFKMLIIIWEDLALDGLHSLFFPAFGGVSSVPAAQRLSSL